MDLNIYNLIIFIAIIVSVLGINIYRINKKLEAACSVLLFQHEFITNLIKSAEKTDGDLKEGKQYVN